MIEKLRARGASEAFLAELKQHLSDPEVNIVPILGDEWKVHAELLDRMMSDVRKFKCVSRSLCTNKMLYPDSVDSIIFNIRDSKVLACDTEIGIAQVDMDACPVMGDHVLCSFGDESVRVPVAYGVYLAQDVIGLMVGGEDDRVRLVPHYVRPNAFSAISPVRWGLIPGDLEDVVVFMDYGSMTVDIASAEAIEKSVK